MCPAVPEIQRGSLMLNFLIVLLFPLLFFHAFPVLHFLCPGFQASFFVGVQSSHTWEKDRQQRDADRASIALCPQALDPDTHSVPRPLICGFILWAHRDLASLIVLQLIVLYLEGGSMVANKKALEVFI